jgi:hypothetical protein
VLRTLVKDKFTKIPVSHDQNALLLKGYREDCLIGEAMRVVPGDRLHVMAKLS